MCGFAGIVAWGERCRTSRSLLEAMSSRIAHRGPDGQGLFLNHCETIRASQPQVGLVHRRLAIIDLDPRANQPFTDAAGRQLLYNGEIYNFRDLRARLTQLLPNYLWRTDCDTEVLLAAYDAWGEKCLEHLNGMFAFAIWDQPRNRLFLARDRMGQKPLYFAAMPASDRVSNDPRDITGQTPLAGVAFASEPAALLPIEWIDRELRPDRVRQYLTFGYAQDSLYRGMTQIAPGEYAISEAGRSCKKQYFYPAVAAAPPELDCSRADNSDATHRTRQLLSTAVRRQLVSDVPVGCFLSGGVDSSIIASAASKAMPAGQRLLTFSIGFDDPRYDESEFARAVAAHLGTDHRSFTVKPDAANDLPKIAAAFGEPFGDSSALATYYLARETRQFVKVCLSGDGGDEMFAGYDRYRAMRWGSRLQFLRESLPSGAAAAMKSLADRGGHPKAASTRIKRFLASLHLPDDQRYARYLMLDGRADEQHDERIAHLFAQQRSAYRDVVRAAMAVDRATYLPEDVLTKVDRCSMQFALEVRSPFLDHDLAGFAARLPVDQLLGDGPKRLLREAFSADLPDWVFRRKKMGFAVPIGQWFRDELRPMLRDHLLAADSLSSHYLPRSHIQRLIDEHEQNRVDHSQRLYALLMLELWRRQMISR